VIALIALFTLTSCFEDVGEPGGPAGWRAMASGTDENLRGVAGLESGEAFAVGDNGVILYYDGASWSPMESGTTANLVGVWAGATDNALATGEGGTVLYYDGVAWVAMDAGTTEDIGAIWGFAVPPPGWLPNQLPLVAFAVGGGPPGTIVHFDGLEWRQIDTGGTDELLAIRGWASYSNSLLAVGANGSVRYADGIQWSGPWTASWRGIDTGSTEDLVAVFGDAPNNVFVVRNDGVVIQNTERFVDGIGSGVWLEVTRVEGNGLSAMAARNYNDLFLVGADGVIVNFDRLDTREMRSPSQNTLRAVWSGESTVLAVGDAGTILRYSRRPQHRPCPLNVRMDVTSAQNPVITWSPGCPVSKIVIEDHSFAGSYGNVRWFVETDGNLIYPDVTWGTVPPGAVERRMSLGPRELAGDPFSNPLYRVSLFRRDAGGETRVGSWNVIPQADGTSATTRASSSGGNVFYTQRVEPTGAAQDEYSFGELQKASPNGAWRTIADPSQREAELNIRPIVLVVLDRDPETDETILRRFRARLAVLPPFEGQEAAEVLWDWEDF